MSLEDDCVSINVLQSIFKQDFYGIYESVYEADSAEEIVELSYNMLSKKELTDTLDNICDKIVNFTLNNINNTYLLSYSSLSYEKRSSMLPTNYFNNELRDYLLKERSKIVTIINRYIDLYESTYQDLQRVKRSTNNSYISGGLIGAAVGALTFGPIVAAIGGLSAGKYAETKMKEIYEMDYEVAVNNLADNFTKVIEKIDGIIDSMLDNLVTAIGTYNYLLSKI